jgi:Ser/Thr protein kinase RdoA (MazF antagonist)
MMRPYNELTMTGKIRRLRQLALKALEKYDLCIEWVKFLTVATNTMFLIRTADGGKFVLRIYSDEETTLKENQAEMFWLDTLKRDTNLKVTEPIACRNGEYINIVSVPSVPEERRCVLFKWIPGQTLDNHLSSESYYKYGQLLAKLHDHASTLKPLPAHIQPKKWNKVFYYPDEPVVYDIPEYSYLFPPERVELVKKVIVHADDVFARLFEDKDGQILIHGDLHYRNVHFYRGELYALDFEDVNLGYPVQDIAVTLYYGRQHDGYNEWKAAFKQGYCSVKRWPTEGERTIETLMAARSVMFINYVARINPSPQEYIEKRCEELVRFLKTYS